MLRTAIAPAASAYILFLVVLVAYRRSGQTRPPAAGCRAGPPLGSALVGYVVRTAAGGYVIFLGIVILFYPILGGTSPDLVPDALGEGLVLAFGVVPAFLALSWLEHVLHRRDTRRHHGIRGAADGRGDPPTR